MSKILRWEHYVGSGNICMRCSFCYGNAMAQYGDTANTVCSYMFDEGN
jgi:hypothetical protein